MYKRYLSVVLTTNVFSLTAHHYNYKIIREQGNFEGNLKMVNYLGYWFSKCVFPGFLEWIVVMSVALPFQADKWNRCIENMAVVKKKEESHRIVLCMQYCGNPLSVCTRIKKR